MHTTVCPATYGQKVRAQILSVNFVIKDQRLQRRRRMSYKTYVCVFNYDGLTIRTESVGGIAMFEDGFWINEDLEFTKLSDAAHWIPPGQIKYITKENRGD